VYRQSKQSNVVDNKTDVKAIYRQRATWLCAAYFLAYVGTETAISGWVVSFMLRSRDASLPLASLASSGYWIGMAIGRLVLGFGTDRIGVRRATALYFIFAVGLEVLFATVSSPVVSVLRRVTWPSGRRFPSFRHWSSCADSRHWSLPICDSPPNDTSASTVDRIH
jgi:fucose permease